MAWPLDGLAWTWLLPASWLVHDVEEVVTIERWSRAWAGRVAGRAAEPDVRTRLVAAMASTRRRFAVAVAPVGCVVVGATVAGVLDPDGVGLLVYATILGGDFLHGFVHLGQSIVFRGYTPGVVTAVLVVIPSSLALYGRLLSAGLVDVRTAAVTGLLGLVLFVPIVLGANELASRVA